MAHTNIQHRMDFFDGLLGAAGQALTAGPAPDDLRAGARCIPHCLVT